MTSVRSERAVTPDGGAKAQSPINSNDIRVNNTSFYGKETKIFKGEIFMFDIIEALWRLVILAVAAFVQFIAAILSGVATLFGKGGEGLKKLSSWILRKIDEGQYEEKMKTIAEE